MLRNCPAKIDSPVSFMQDFNLCLELLSSAEVLNFWLEKVGKKNGEKFRFEEVGKRTGKTREKNEKKMREEKEALPDATPNAGVIRGSTFST